MSEQIQLEDLIPIDEKPNNIPPFEVGELVMMRASALRLVKFYRYQENDIGVVLEVKKSNHDYWMVNVHWQKFIPKNGKSIVRHTRLKKVRIRKNVQQKN